MSSNLTGLPPSALARLTAQANLQGIAVRLLDVPQGLPTPLKLAGTVTGQNQDGSLQVETEKGVVRILLKDRQPLPQGQRLELDIPAGKSPAQAVIRPAPDEPSSSPPAPPPSSSASPSLKLERGSAVRVTEIENAVRAAGEKGGTGQTKNPVQVGQTVRVIPLPGGSVEPRQAVPMTAGSVLGAIIQAADSLPPVQKDLLLNLLARMDLSALNKLPQQEQLTKQVIDFITNQPVSRETIRYNPIQSFISAKPLDVQIVGFMSSSPTTGAPVVTGQLSPFPSQEAQALISSNSAAPQKTLSQSLPPVYTPQTLAELESGISADLSPKLEGVSARSLLTMPAPTAGPAGQAMPAAPVPSPSLPPQVIAGQVTGFTRQDFPVISLIHPVSGEPQLYVGQFQAGNLQPGSTVFLSLIPASAKQTGAASPAKPLAPTAPLPALLPLSAWLQPEPWTALSDFIETVHHVNPAAAQTLTQMLPSPAQPQSLGGLALLFLSVMKSGDLGSWVTPQVMSLLRQSGKGDSIRALTGDLTTGARVETLPLPQDWRATVLPLYFQQQIFKVPVYYKGQHEEGEDDSDGQRERRQRMMRFLFDLKLARMGNVQIDGFMQKQRLDMIMRTKAPLSLAMQRTMQGLYTTAMEKSQLSGELTFQFRPEHWVRVDTSGHIIDTTAV